MSRTSRTNHREPLDRLLAAVALAEQRLRQAAVRDSRAQLQTRRALAYSDAMSRESDPDMAESLVGDPTIILTGQAAIMHGEAHRCAGGAVEEVGQ